MGNTNLLFVMGGKHSTPTLRPEDVAALVKTTGMEEAQVRDVFDEFVKENPNGKIKKSNFKKTMQKAIPDKETREGFEDVVFEVFDGNDDGVIDFAEFMVVFHMAWSGSPEELLINLFKVFDVNNDGLISKPELKKLVPSVVKLVGHDDVKTVSNEMLAVAWEMEGEGEDGSINIENYVKSCIENEKFSDL